MKVNGSLTLKLREKNYRLVGLVYISPWLIGFLLFQLYPFISSFLYSFTDYSILSIPEFVGLKNYIYMFTRDEFFFQSLKVTLQYVLIAVPAKLVFALLIAMLLNSRRRMVNLFRTVYYLPSIMGGSVAIAIMWRFLFMKEGLVNGLLAKLSLPSVDWLGSPNVALPTIGLLAVWQFGSSMVIFLAGLKQVPKELYEASTVDGASALRKFFSITVPLLTPVILFNLVMQMVNAFQEFTAAFVITKGGPLKSTYMYGLLLYENAFEFFRMGYASALSWILFVIILILTGYIFKSSSRWVHYEDGGDF